MRKPMPFFLVLLLSAVSLSAETRPLPLVAGGSLPAEDGTSMAALLVRGEASTHGLGEVGALAVSQGHVYAAGVYAKDGDPIPHACVWIDGARTDLEPDAPSQVNGIALMDGDVYVSGGALLGDSDTPCLWKNGKRIDLDGGGADAAWTTGIAADRGAVYVSGNLKVGPNTNACYWRNGNLVPLSGPERYCYSLGVAVHRGELVVVGAEKRDGKAAACVWRNGVQGFPAVPDSRGASSVRAIDAAVDGADLYVLVELTAAGGNRTGYFRGNSWVEVSVDTRPPAESAVISRSFHPVCIAARGGTVYVAGQMSEKDRSGESVIGCLAWSNGSEVFLDPLLYVFAVEIP
jgi:hypothetical protein